ncbi:replication initiation protein [Cytophagaceae bacterium DM2B3-1]|uniref:Replication initiation protein n=1 Tax=Xanthocytophaga flava TaxID=3048013 RepID=A0ABT7CH24_9BACT|nr:replication initiation protein [Xanthocytophaga flavus]MDJ1472351.1 replication initiation protein [Xanthocytophaga flavus]MDJ1493048.1 replication initiation protein [Xanthocytophaga flavus]
MEQQLEIFSAKPKEVRQHNNLIFAPFAMGSVESKIFISMLERINRTDTEFPLWRIPLSEILPRKDGDSYEHLKKAAVALKSQVIDIAPVDPMNPNRKRFRLRSIVDKCDHDSGTGFLLCQFHPDVKEYLLNLIDNYTPADLATLKMFKDERTVRFYWMLRARFRYEESRMAKTSTVSETVKIQITVEECRNCLLKDIKSYPNPKDIKRHILEKVVKPEIDKTDCAFEFGDPVKQGNKTLAWTFIRRSGSVTVLPLEPLRISAKLIEALEGMPLDSKGIRRISDALCMDTDGFEASEAFVWFLLHKLTTSKDKDKIASPGGQLIRWIEDRKFKTEFLKKTKTPSSPTPSSEIVTYSETELIEMHQNAMKRKRTSLDFASWVKEIYLDNGFERQKIDNVWFVVKEK